MTRRLCLPLAALCLGGAAACVDLEEKPVTQITSAYYNTPAGFEAAVNAMYTPMRSHWPLERGSTMTVFGTDEYQKGADGSYKFFNDYTAQLNADVDFLRDTWFDFYKGINTANTVIAAAATANLPDATKNLRVGEAKFLRALYYFTLVRTFGDIPLYTEPTPGVTTETTREPIGEGLRPDHQGPARGRDGASRQGGAVRARRQAGGAAPARRGLSDSRRRGTSSTPRSPRRSSRPWRTTRGSRWCRAYKDLWRIDNEDNSEIVFSIQFTADPLTTGSGNKLHLYWGYPYDLEPGMQRDIANDRPFRRFRPTTWLLALWNRTIDSRYEDMHKVAWIANNPNNLPKNANGTPKFLVGDTAVFFPGKATITAAERAATRYKLYAESEYQDAIFPVLNKYLDRTRTSTNQEEGQRDHPLMRLANTYLMLAEALMKDGKPDLGSRVAEQGAHARRQARPGRGDAGDAVANMNIDFILDERARELTGETTRWFDLKRTGKLVERVKLYNPGGAPNIKPEHNLRPIPNAEILNSTGGMTQNPGY